MILSKWVLGVQEPRHQDIGRLQLPKPLYLVPLSMQISGFESRSERFVA